MQYGIEEYFSSLISFAVVISIFGVLFFFIEKIKPVHKDISFFKPDFRGDILLAFSNVLFAPLMRLAGMWTALIVLAPYVPFRILDKAITGFPFFLQVFVVMLVLDFAVYWRHRFSHFGLWSFHSVHHSAEELTWTTKLRLHPVDILAASIFDALAMHFIGFESPAILTASLIMMAIDFWAHTNLDFKFPKPFRYLLASPHSHRWHHANVREAYDKNFCSVFPFYDVIFGTFYHPEELPPKYGLSKMEQKDFPSGKFLGWMAYPFRREYKRLKKRFKKS